MSYFIKNLRCADIEVCFCTCGITPQIKIASFILKCNHTLKEENTRDYASKLPEEV